jgi:hypothetical protein
VTSLPNLITNNATLRQSNVARSQSVTQMMGQPVATAPARQPQGRAGEVSWSTQVYRYLHSNPGSALA